MDLHEFDGQDMYFDEPTPVLVQELLLMAANAYGSQQAEDYLRQAQAYAPKNPTVKVALYRFYFYQHRLQDALEIANDVMAQVSAEMALPPDWNSLTINDVEIAGHKSFTKVRFYLLALKGAAYIQMRIGYVQDGIAMLNKIIELDSLDRLGARALLNAIGPVPCSDSYSQTTAR